MKVCVDDVIGTTDGRYGVVEGVTEQEVLFREFAYADDEGTTTPGALHAIKPSEVASIR